MKKTLYILRHAKAETGAPHQDDHSRRLVDRGVEAAQIVGAYMFRQGIKPVKVLCSDAVRTRETWAQIEANYPSPNVEFTRKLYLCSAHEMLGLLSGLPEAVSFVLLVAHNPGIHQLCLKLGQQGDEDVIDAMHLKFPTAALATIELDSSWSDVRAAVGRLVDYVTPKMLAGIVDD